MKEKINYILNSIEGVHQAMKMIHWSTTNDAEHSLTDEIDGMFLKYEDKLAEVSMGALDDTFGHGSLKTLLPSHKDVKGILKEFQGDLTEAIKKADGGKYIGIKKVLKDFYSDIDQLKFRNRMK